MYTTVRELLILGVSTKLSKRRSLFAFEETAPVLIEFIKRRRARDDNLAWPWKGEGFGTRTGYQHDDNNSCKHKACSGEHCLEMRSFGRGLRFVEVRRQGSCDLVPFTCRQQAGGLKRRRNTKFGPSHLETFFDGMR
ncbi:hypothetical protein CBR61_14025 [Porphyrobacter sp. CACIAM 03H1]|nr:hypothetical protein CBR61_14025 [Porphyrobacter sp. CACIAM 03H1]